MSFICLFISTFNIQEVWLNSQKTSEGNIAHLEDLASSIENSIRTSSENPFHPDNPEGSIIKVHFSLSLSLFYPSLFLSFSFSFSISFFHPFFRDEDPEFFSKDPDPDPTQLKKNSGSGSDSGSDLKSK